ncbi:glycoside hydrolase family 15 protein [Salsipaludibacter albus]|uniref:glycoside hydrolase family 15 protein n=1 Tax=Salsipaludibacter albus TaxID=2849650 RepID=UPI001EE4176F|nr:glycoside hydrolase family 15 protein [Salsipaludibacter albus]MBY5161382.1 glycoside hydrolase family 15 protein [Salsipaludibacter albus]
MDDYPDIAELALVGDCHSAALVGLDGGVEWCCFRRFDAPPVFAPLLDRRRGGRCLVTTVGEHTTTRAYEPDTNVLRTTFEAPDGVLEVVDAFVVDDTRASGSTGEVEPHMQLVRWARCVEGRVELEVDVQPRFEYGLTRPRIDLVDDGLVTVTGGPDALVVTSDLPLESADATGCVARERLTTGDVRFLSIEYQRPHQLEVRPRSRDEIEQRLDGTRRFWRRWSSRIGYDGPHRDAVVRSALVLKALTNAPTGAIVAAPTTSLPEAPSGGRSWDYRYTWLRDTALILDALFALGLVDEGEAFAAWLQRTTAGRAHDLQPLYGVGGERLLHEWELDGLAGYRSAPVRIGNAASQQFQLDVHGELVDAVWRLHRHGGQVDRGLWAFVKEVADVITERWDQPDQGIWEVRGRPRHFVSSKVFAWIGLARAASMATDLEPDLDTTEWEDAAAAVRNDVAERGVDPDSGALTRSYDDDAADAANLVAVLEGFPDEDGSILPATVDRVLEELSAAEGLVHRYRVDDGIDHDEGAFVICSFWLVSALAAVGEVERAHERFTAILDHANDVGLLSEEVDPDDGALLGNFPQAFSHAGLVQAALDLAAADGRGAA